ncbi:hypothetical protein [Methylocystis echinoides]|uniref:Arc-like DNA binding domain-containing protein n=1 Tax=Methylocystis echinoides TaxID=29468 RepID=A0A9W6GVQ0_9HYPH|nr:hypothetical protein [Methylocystis echinoides]GLI93941.1 hypothetical protein LMG27198_29330 [Methylocystis echinoides]
MRLEVNRRVEYGVEMARNDPELRVRIPEELRKLINEKAAESGLSLSALVVELLSQAMEWRDYDIPSMAESIDRLEEQVGRLMGDVDELMGRSYDRD